MQKIPTLYQRNLPGDRLIRDELTPGCEWVLAGKGVATVKWDGSCCLIENGIFFKRYDCKKGRKRPAKFIPAQEKMDEKTGHWPGWIPVGDGLEDRWHQEAFSVHPNWEDGTYELLGPKVQGNPDRFPVHELVRHGEQILPNIPTDFLGLKALLSTLNFDFEGIVWNHPDGRMAKIKKKDFGFTRIPFVVSER